MKLKQSNGIRNHLKNEIKVCYRSGRKTLVK